MAYNSKSVVYSGFFRRFGALLLDFHFLPFTVILLIFFGVLDKSQFPIVVLILMPIYDIVSLFFYGQTLGKWLVGIRVVKEDFKRPSLLQLIRREFFLKPMHILFFGLGVWYMFSNNKRQTLYDKKIGLVVLQVRKEWIVHVLTFVGIVYFLVIVLYESNF